MGWTIERLAHCTSTMDEARRRARDGAADGTVVFASRMESGRGQHGNRWHAPEGGVYASVVLRDLADPHLLTLTLGNAVADVLEVAGADARLKWVNDVLVDGRKIAGILAEAESTAASIDFIIAGIGINVNGSAAGWPDGLDATAVTLEEILGVGSCIEDLEAVLVDRVGYWIEALRAGKDDDILAAWRARDGLVGRRVRVDGREGTAQGIDERGRLVVDGTPVDSGPVEVLEAVATTG